MGIKSLPMEAETIPMLVSGFVLVMVLVVVVIAFLMFKRKDFVYSWFIGQVIFLCLSFHFILKVLRKNDTANSMVSEDISLSIGLSALMWTVSMFLMLIGIWKLSKKRN